MELKINFEQSSIKVSPIPFNTANIAAQMMADDGGASNGQHFSATNVAQEATTKSYDDSSSSNSWMITSPPAVQSSTGLATMIVMFVSYIKMIFNFRERVGGGVIGKKNIFYRYFNIK
jgi:hypothetical protein